jgi:hypothetical protein
MRGRDVKEVYQELKRRTHDAIPEQGACLRAVVGGFSKPVCAILTLWCVLASPPEARTVCGRAARKGLCGGGWATGVPTATDDIVNNVPDDRAYASQGGAPGPLCAALSTVRNGPRFFLSRHRR